MNQKQKILEIADIQLMVNTFYDKVRKDELLAPVFEERIGGKWAQHLEKMYKFWQTVLLQEHTYFGSPFTPHALLPVNHQHFSKWIDLFTETIDELFDGDVAIEAKWRAAKMAEMFEYKIKYYQENATKPIL